MPVTTNTRKLAALLGASGAGIANDGTLTSAAIGEVIVAGDIADDAITGGKLANDIAISTTGNIATTGSGTLAVAGICPSYRSYNSYKSFILLSFTVSIKRVFNAS